MVRARLRPPRRHNHHVEHRAGHHTCRRARNHRRSASHAPLRIRSQRASAAHPCVHRPTRRHKGTFKILVSGQQIGKEEFSIAPNGGDWSAHGSTDIQSPKGNTHVTGNLVVHSDGVPVHYEWSTQGAKKASATIGFAGGTATVELHLEGAKPFTQQFTFTAPLVVVLDDNLYYQYTFLARLYDWDKKGEQTFSVLVPQEMTPGAVTVDSMGEQVVNGQKVQELRVRTEDNEIDLFLDGPKLVRLVAPAANAEIIRE